MDKSLRRSCVSFAANLDALVSIDISQTIRARLASLVECGAAAVMLCMTAFNSFSLRIPTCTGWIVRYEESYDSRLAVSTQVVSEVHISHIYLCRGCAQIQPQVCFLVLVAGLPILRNIILNPESTSFTTYEMFDNASPAKLWLIGLASIITLTIGYLYRINSLLKGVPDEVRKLAGSRWTEDQLRKTYHQLQINEIDYTNKIPPKQDRRYIVTGGNGKILYIGTYRWFADSPRPRWRLHCPSTSRSRHKASQHSHRGRTKA